jgi:hypothetical protein
MIQEELHQLTTTRRDLRKFGLMVGGVFAVLGGFFLFRHKGFWPYLLVPGGLLVFFGVVAPRALKGVYLGWMALAFSLGLIMSTLVLSLCFFLILTPLAFLARLAGKDFLSLKLDPTVRSYWVRDRPANRQPADLERQF